METLNQVGKLYIGSLSSNILDEISRSTLSIQVSYSMDMASQLSFTVLESVDTNFSSSSDSLFYSELQFAKNNYFQIGQDVIFETNTLGTIESNNSDFIKQKQLFEIASVSISQGQGGSPVWQIMCYTKAIQQMKRDRKPAAITGQGTEFIKRAAFKYGLKFWGQQTTKNYTITKASGDKQAESLWDVMKRLAGDAKFVLYEVDGYLIFASEKYILEKWGSDSESYLKMNKKKNISEKKIRRWVPLQFPVVLKGTPGVFRAYAYPSFSLSENSPYDADGSISMDRANGVQLRPGMTAYVGNIDGFSDFYLIDSVSFDDRTPDPVAVSFRKPEKTDKEKLQQLKKREIAVGNTFEATSLQGIVAISNPVIPLRVSAKQGSQVIPPQFDARIIPLPSESNQYAYPKTYASESITQGNVPLYSRPILNTSDGDVKTTYSITVYQKANGDIYNEDFENAPAGTIVVLLTPIWEISGVARDISNWTITSVVSTNNTVTLTLSVTNLFLTGDFIKIKNCSIPRLNGWHTLTSRTSTTVSFSYAIEDFISTPSTGSIYSENPTTHKYLIDGLFLAKCASPVVMEKYADLIHQQQVEVLKVRYPNVDLTTNPPGTYPDTPIGGTGVAYSYGAGYFAGGHSGSFTNVINKYSFPTTVMSALTGTLTNSAEWLGAYSNSGVAGYFVGGGDGSTDAFKAIDRINFTSDAKTTLTAYIFCVNSGCDSSFGREKGGSLSNSGTAGYLVGGLRTTESVRIDKLTYATEVNAVIATVLPSASSLITGMSNSGVAGYFSGGTTGNQVVRKLLFSNDTLSTLPVTFSSSSGYRGGMANSGVAGYIGGGQTIDTIDKISFTTETTSVSSGVLTLARWGTAGMADTGYSGYFGGGFVGSNRATVDKVAFATDTVTATTSLLNSTRYLAALANCGVF